jgi:peptide/nickel transport system ATP-binding protein
VTGHLLEVEDLKVTFRSRHPRLAGKAHPGLVRAVDGVSFTVDGGEMLALVGESGSGKTTTGQAAMRLVERTGGVVKFKGRDIYSLTARDLRRVRQQMQPVYQDPYESLDPRYTVRRVVEEPLRIHHLGVGAGERTELVIQALERVGLTPAEAFLDRLPHELSGGQRQRVSIAAALVLGPDLLVADEPVSMLDVSVRAGILDLLDRLRGAGLGILMITHDLSTASHYADRIAVMYLGRIVEIGPSRTVITDPRHPYTRALLSVVPRADRAGGKRAILRGEVPNATDVPSGCRFHPRCPAVFDSCPSIDPRLEPAVPSVPGHQAACLLPSSAGEDQETRHVEELGKAPTQLSDTRTVAT